MSDPLDLDAAVDVIAKWNVGSLSPAALGAFMDTVAMPLVVELRTARAERDAAKADADSTHAAWRASTEANQADYDALAARIEAARAVHAKRTRINPDAIGSSFTYCDECEKWAPWPCPTIRALADPETTP